MRAMHEPERLVLKDEDQLKAAQELGRKKVPNTVPFEACVDCVRHFMTMECLEVSFVLVSSYKNSIIERDSRLTPSRTNLRGATLSHLSLGRFVTKIFPWSASALCQVHSALVQAAVTITSCKDCPVSTAHHDVKHLPIHLHLPS